MRPYIASRFSIWLALTLSALNLVGAAHGQTENAGNPAAPPPPPSQEPAADYSGSPLGSLGGLRPILDREGIKISGIYTGEVFGNVHGGLETGSILEGLLELDLDIDLNKAVGLPGGSLHLGGFEIHGPSLSDKYTGDLSDTSNIDAYDTVRFAEYWYQQDLWNGRISLKIGQFLTDNEFYYSDYGNLFICGSFGAFTFLANNFPFSPNYPMSAPGFRVLFHVTDSLDFRAALFSGSTLSQSQNNRSFPHFASRDGVLLLSEAAYHYNHGENAAGLPGTYKLGIIFHSHYDGALNANPESVDRSECGVYFAADQSVWRKAVADKKETAPSLGFFTRLGYMPEDVGFVSRYVEGGFNFNGLLPGRQDDIFGVAFTHSGISNDASRRSVESGGPSFGAETVVEGTYSVSVKSWLKLQPDFQYLIDPGAREGARNATVLGLRTNVTF